MYRRHGRAYTPEEHDPDTGDAPVESDAAGLGVVQAASRLGISVDAVRKRLRRGTLSAYKVDGEWRIILDDPGLPGTDTDQPDDHTETAEAVQDRDQPSSEVLFLRQLTEHQAGIIAQQSTTIAELTRRVLEVPAGTADGPAPGTPTERPQRAVESPKRQGWLDRLLGR